LSREFKGDFNRPINTEGELADDYREHLEEILDMPTVYEVLDVCGGLKLNDPKLIQEIQDAAMETVEDGTT
jgi:hypothetical protein